MTSPGGPSGPGPGGDSGTGPGRILRPILFGFLRMVVWAIAYLPGRSP